MLRRLGAFFFDIIQVVVFAVAIFLFIYLLILQPHKIKGLSMSPNFPDGEYLLTDKVSYRFHEPQRGDVIVFKAPTSNDGEEFIKRIIGLPGETIMIKDSKVYINGQLVREPYLANNLVTSSGTFLQEGKETLIPDGYLAVLGDNRPHSSDSRAWGFIQPDDITGRAWLIYWPIKNMGVVESVDYIF